MSFRRPVLCLVLLACLSVLALYSKLVGESDIFTSRDTLPRDYEQRTGMLREALPLHGVVGYASDIERNPMKHYFLMQYALTPVRLSLELEHGHDLIVGNFLDPGNIATSPRLKEYTLIEDYGNGIVLLTRKGER